MRQEEANMLNGNGYSRRGLVAGLLTSIGLTQSPINTRPALSEDKPKETTEQRDARMKWFREAKFGVFVCWGPCSIAEGEIGWSRNGPRPGLQPDHAEGGVPLETYDNLYKQFNPTQFKATEWAQLIKESGAKYIIFLTKHHDGFCLFDSKLTEYKVTNTPFKRDVTAELAEACRQAGLRIFWYYSPPDWHHPDYLTKDHARYIEYLHGQIRELLTNYGKIDGLWFDGLQGNAETWDTPRMFKMIRELQPDIIINNRAGLAEDFDTPEQTIGQFQLDRPWESCITMSTAWSWSGTSAPVQSLKECLHLLIRCAGGGGNLALDTGPMPDGRIDPRQAERYRQMGVWLKKYGESIYATTGGPYQPSRGVVSTRKGKTVYLHVLGWEEDVLKLPPLRKKIMTCTALSGGKPTFRQTDEALEIRLPAEHRDEIDTIIALKLGVPASGLKPISLVTRGSLTIGKKAAASSIWNEDYNASKAFDGDEGTRWGGAPGSRSGWLEVDLGKPRTFNRILILESPWNRVRKFQLQYLDGEVWRTFHEGTTLGEFQLRFEPVTARSFRLNILEAVEVPTIWEVDLYPPEGEKFGTGIHKEE
ncbi:MAG: alpha-L-fucosidase [Armatimonadetes bacterium]|nr:alpha-L-fucosidase [Armatimonadota bacterium]